MLASAKDNNRAWFDPASEEGNNRQKHFGGKGERNLCHFGGHSAAMRGFDLATTTVNPANIAWETKIDIEKFLDSAAPRILDCGTGFGWTFEKQASSRQMEAIGGHNNIASSIT